MSCPQEQQRIPFTLEDLSSGSQQFRVDDKVSFQIRRLRRSDATFATNVTLVERAASPQVRGIISSVKDMFGFIEREDKCAEIFFHHSEFNGNAAPNIGTEVSFELGRRQGKEVACNVSILPPGSVQLETIGEVRSL